MIDGMGIALLIHRCIHKAQWDRKWVGGRIHTARRASNVLGDGAAQPKGGGGGSGEAARQQLTAASVVAAIHDAACSCDARPTGRALVLKAPRSIAEGEKRAAGAWRCRSAAILDALFQFLNG